MKKFLFRSGLLALISFSSVASAHSGLFPHVAVKSEFTHFLLHALMVLPVAVLVFFLGRMAVKEKPGRVRSSRSD